MQIQDTLLTHIKTAAASIYGVELDVVEFQPTRKDFEGDVTVVVFPMLRVIKGNPAQIGDQIGQYLKENVEEVIDFNVIKGFLNLVISDTYYLDFFNSIRGNKIFGTVPERSQDAMLVEYSSPNTNKPLHLGHIRNNLLGYSVAEILKASGKKVYKTQIINDRGIHICKSMLAWQKFGKGETPESTGLKGDKLVGNYYVAFDKAYKSEVTELVAKGTEQKEAEKNAPLLLEAQEMLIKWEAGDQEVMSLWKTMNGWVDGGLDVKYKNLGVDFDKLYYESDTYLLGPGGVAKKKKKGG